MKTVEIEISLIDLDQNMRVVDNDPELASLMSSIQRLGRLINAVEVTKKENGRFSLIDGHRRFAAVKNLGWPKIWASVISDLNPVDRLVTIHDENKHRKAPTQYENGVIFQDLLNQGLNIAEIAVRCSTTTTDVKTCLQEFKQIPVKFRPNVKKLIGSKKGPGDISAGVSKEILQKARTFDLTNHQKTQLYEAAKNKTVTKEAIKGVAQAMSNGFALNQALKLGDDVGYGKLNFTFSKSKAKKIEKKLGLPYNLIVLTFLSKNRELGIQAPSVKRRSFLKDNKNKNDREFYS